jgi:D-arginine dehydrogenase
VRAFDIAVIGGGMAGASAAFELAAAHKVVLLERESACGYHSTGRSGPLVNDVGEKFYFKPDAGRLLVSPADATPSPPVDAQPEEEDLAIGVARLEAATILRVGRLPHRWAGLRSFVADGAPVVGWDAEVDGFYWLAGQGGYGIKTAPALARASAGLIAGDGLPADLLELGLAEHDLAPARCRIATAAV